MSSTINAKTGKVLSVAGLDAREIIEEGGRGTGKANDREILPASISGCGARGPKRAKRPARHRPARRGGAAQPGARRLRRPIAALGGQRRIRLHGRSHRPADFSGALRSADAALYPVAVGPAYGSQPEWKRSVGFAAGHVRYLWAQGGVRQQFGRAGATVQLVARESAPAAPRKNRLSD